MTEPVVVNSVRFPSWLEDFAHSIESERELASIQAAELDIELAPDALWNDLTRFLKETVDEFWTLSDIVAPAPVIATGENRSLEAYWTVAGRHLSITFWNDPIHVATFVGRDDEDSANVINGEFDFGDKREWILSWLMK